MDHTDLALIVAAIAAAGGAIATAIRFMGSRIVRAIDASTKALGEQAVSSAVHAETLRNVADRVEKVEEAVTAVAEWCDQHTGVRDVPHGIRRKPKERASTSTPARGVGIGEYHVRGRTHGDEED